MGNHDFDLKVSYSNDAHTTIISPAGGLVLEHIFRFQESWRSVTTESLVFDLSAVNYVDSAAIGSLINAQVSCTNKKRRMALAGVSERVMQMLKVTHVDSLFKFYPDVESAQAEVRAAAASS
ncbi:MAG TPA: STAS domain-containing protein [Terriglobales bacterium]|nr:STAS domain-containing protein [Terriglobales bacterium]